MIVDDGPIVPAIRDHALLEARLGPELLEIDATVANVTPEELWVGVEPPHHTHLSRLVDVRLILVRDARAAAWADTKVKRIVGAGGRVAALWRPESWVGDSRRSHSRVDLRLPAYLRYPGSTTVGSAWTTNVSVGGFQCLTSLRLEMGERMEVSLSLSPMTTLACQAQVVRIGEAPDDPKSKKLLVAFKFLLLSDAEQAQIAAAMAALD